MTILKKKYHHKKYFEVNDSVDEYNEDCVEIKFENSMPLTDELDYFVSNLHKKTFEISSIKHGVDVIQILDKVEKELESE